MYEWQYHRLIESATPGLPWLETEDGIARWTQLDLNQNGRNIAAFRVGRKPPARAPVTVALAQQQPWFFKRRFNLETD